MLLGKNYIDNIPEPKSNILHDSYKKNLTILSYDNCSQIEFSNLLFNSNLNDPNIIK